jgi:hypothetical protein
MIYDYTRPTAAILSEELGSEIGKPIPLDQISSWLWKSSW